MNGSSCCSTPLPEFAVVSVSDSGHSDKCVVISACFNLHFSDDICCGTFVHMHICNLYIFFGEVSIKVVGPFFSWIVSYC